ncbi:MAG: C25 family cysteine peptidase [Pirellulales bacterium]
MIFVGLLASLLLAVAAPPDTLVVCSRDLQGELAPWLTYRQSQGHVIEVIEPAADFDAQRADVRAANRRGTLKNVLLVGDGTATGEAAAHVVPVELSRAKINVRYGSEPDLATDYGLADLDGDRQPELCVGRLPVQTRQELAQVIDKIIAYESDCRGAAWRRRVNLVAGTGRFSVVVDRLIETTAGRLISDMVPADREVNFTYGSWRSPFCPSPRQFSKHTLARLNEGCHLWIYAGHGQPEQLDEVHVENARYPILANSDLGRLECETGRPIAVLLACYTGAFDGKQPSVAERFLLEPGGPVAVLAASRVSMPYGNTVLGAELMRAVFADRATTLGEVVRQAKSRLITRKSSDLHRQMIENLAAMFTPNQADRDEERWEHAQMYNLLGDPLLRINHPAALQLSVPAGAKASEAIHVTGTAPHAGKLRIEWTLPNERRLASGTMRRQRALDPAAEREQDDQYHSANNTVLGEIAIDVSAGAFEADLLVPDLSTGRYVLRALLTEESQWASASANVEVIGEPAAATN